MINVVLSHEHRQMLMQLEKGVIWRDLSDDQQEAVRYLESIGLAGARVDLKDDFWTTTEKGKAYLFEQEELDKKAENEVNQRAQDKAEQRKEKKADRLHDWFLLIGGFVLGVVADHYFEILGFVASRVTWLLDSVFGK